MSQKAVPVCANCARSTEVSISCTKCFQICCATCFNLRSDLFTVAANDNKAGNRVCPKCSSSDHKSSVAISSSTVVVKTEPVDDQPKAAVEPVPGLCAVHRKDCKLFCLNCTVAICGSCIDEGQPHELHHIDNFSIVYREKLSELESKLVQAKQSIDALGPRTDICGRNLEMLEKEEAEVLKEIEAISAASKLKVTRKTSIRKERLRAQLQLPAEKGKAVVQIRDMVQGHSAGEFMKQLSKLDELCTNLVAPVPSSSSIFLETVDDIECDLVPAYRFGSFTACGLFRQGNSNFNFFLNGSCDVVWEVTVLKTEILQVKLSVSDPELMKFPHKLMVIVPHADSAKEFRTTFELPGNGGVAAFDVAQVSHLVAQGFNKDGVDLLLKIGIRPLNAVIENRLLNYQYEQVKLKKTSTEMKLTAITGRLDHNHFVMHFTLDVNKFHKHWNKTSFHIVDDEDRRWCMHLYVENDVAAYIELYEGDGTHCSYFIELKHENPLKTITKSSAFAYMEQGSELGWDCFIKWNQLMKDEGFYRDGIIRFRFGVRPL